MIILFLSSGLLLGWSLGANDAANVFGSAVGSKMVSFRQAAIISSIFVIIGSVVQGAGASDTLGRLGAVNAIGGSFTVALAAAIVVFMMTKFALPVSTTQAIVGAIIGWNLFTGNPTDATTLTNILSTWVSGPVLGAVFAVILYILLKTVKRKSAIHLVRFESYIRTGLIIVGAFGAYSLGANNIANVMGVFVPAFNLHPLDLKLFTLSSQQQLFLLGSLAIAAGIITYSRRVMEQVGNNIMELSSESALVVVLSQALVLFIFSSSGLSAFLRNAGLPAIPMVPVSSTQVMIGSIIGIGLYSGARNINFRILGEIAAGWILTPLIAGILTFFSLFFVKNIFGIHVGSKTGGAVPVELPATSPDPRVSEIMQYLILCLIFVGLITALIYYLLDRKKRIELKKSEEKFWKNMK
ncbi:MAG: inorganic phosphate transporter [Bacteroidales bacterium]|nr:inorganic phosphate transporter [Bacteroidales bacterium]MDI9552591.1 inorganic phosphate transporter [Bacteroidota bacterium]HPB12484.1 inorganic phosphate transporter [Bacteroidales bacterium]HPX43035.1 inorganic phosphate transporter [Bacteroidales bacterium]